MLAIVMMAQLCMQVLRWHVVSATAVTIGSTADAYVIDGETAVATPDGADTPYGGNTSTQAITATDDGDAADAAGLKIKINTVALKDDNEHSLRELIAWAHGRGFDLTLIEIMPLGEVDAARSDQFLSLAQVKADLEQGWTLTPLTDNTGGPARYHRVEETGGRLGLITPLTENFCAGCNRVRLTATGRLYLCLGQDDAADLRAVIRAHDDDVALDAALDAAIAIKPRGHDFRIDRAGAAPAVRRHMSVTGG